MTDNALEIRNLNASIGKFSLSNVNFSLEKGTIMGFIGKMNNMLRESHRYAQLEPASEVHPTLIYTHKSGQIKEM